MAFAAPVMRHMNDDHTDALKDYVQYLVGVEGDIDKIEMKRLDKLGFDVRVTKGDDSGVLRIPFTGLFASTFSHRVINTLASRCEHQIQSRGKVHVWKRPSGFLPLLPSRTPLTPPLLVLASRRPTTPCCRAHRAGDGAQGCQGGYCGAVAAGSGQEAGARKVKEELEK